MLSIQELRQLGASLSEAVFRAQLGPFALVQRSSEDNADAVLAPTQMTSQADVEMGILSLLFQFEDLHVATLPPLGAQDVITVGRQPDCTLVIDHPSVSKLHAQLTWSEAEARCSVKDLGSTNGTFLNAGSIGQREVSLRDGDILSFGNAQYWFILTPTLHRRLREGPPMPASP